MIDRYRTRAMRLISEIDAGDNFRELIERELKDRLGVDKNAPAPQNAPAPKNATAPVATDAPVAAAPAVAPAKSATAPNACIGCGTTNDEDAQFCKKCGLKLAA